MSLLLLPWISVHQGAPPTHGGFPWCLSPCTHKYAVLADSAFWIPGSKLSPHHDCKQEQAHLPRGCLCPACLSPSLPCGSIAQAGGRKLTLTESPLPLTAQAGQLRETTVERHSFSLLSVLLQAGMGKATRHSAALPVTWSGSVLPLTSLCQ